MIPKHLKARLLEDQRLQDIIKSSNSGDKPNKSFCTSLADLIVAFVEKKIHEDSKFAKYVRQYLDKENPADPPRCINWRTINRMLSDDDHKPHSAKSLQAVLIFLEVPLESWDVFKDYSADLTKEHRYLGAYYLYRYSQSRNEDNILRTMIWISHDHGPSMKVEFCSLDERIEKGTAFVKDKVLTIRIFGEKNIEIIAGTPSTPIKAGDLLNGIMISSRTDTPYAKHCIMRYLSAAPVNIKADLITTLYHTSHVGKVAITGAREYGIKFDPIVEFLARKKGELIADPFNHASIEEVTVRNQKAFFTERPDYNVIRDVLGKGNWYSVSSYQPDNGFIAVNRFQFTMYNESKECLFSCERHEGETITIAGYVEYFHELFVLKMSKKNRIEYAENRLLMYSVGKLGDDGHIRASTTLSFRNRVSSRNVKEIFFKSDDTLPDKMSYEDFLSSKIFGNYEKQTVLRNDPAQEWPLDVSGSKTKLDHLKHFADNWIVYIPNAYSENDESLLQIIILVDLTGATSEKVTFKNPNSTTAKWVTYKGIADVYDNNKLLRFINKTDGNQSSTYIFHIDKKDEDTPYLVGVTVDNDMYSLPCADACIAVRYAAFKDFEKEYCNSTEAKNKLGSIENEAKIVVTDDYVYGLLDAFINKHLESDIKTFFFVTYPSIRRKRK